MRKTVKARLRFERDWIDTHSAQMPNVQIVLGLPGEIIGSKRTSHRTACSAILDLLVSWDRVVQGDVVPKSGSARALTQRVPNLTSWNNPECLCGGARQYGGGAAIVAPK